MRSVKAKGTLTSWHGTYTKLSSKWQSWLNMGNDTGIPIWMDCMHEDITLVSIEEWTLCDGCYGGAKEEKMLCGTRLVGQGQEQQ